MKQRLPLLIPFLLVLLNSPEFVSAQICDNAPTYYQDSDDDGYGDMNKEVLCELCMLRLANEGKSHCSTDPRDCDDNDPNITPATMYYKDADGDGYYTATWKLEDHFINSGDGDATCRQSSDWKVAGKTVNLFINDYSHFSTNTSIIYVPKGLGDADDHNGAVNGATVWYHDKDKDGYATDSYTGCCPPNSTEWFYNEQVFNRYNNSFYFTKGIGDCDDNDKNINGGTKWFFDGDKDGYAVSSKVGGCRPGAGWYYSGEILPNGTPNYILGENDCDDSNPALYSKITYYPDLDGDGYRSSTTATTACVGAPKAPAGFTLKESTIDCNDADPAVWQSGTYVRDDDGDWYMTAPMTVCYGATLPAGYLPITTNSRGVDCNDNSAMLTVLRKVYIDADGDSYVGSLTPVDACASSYGSDGSFIVDKGYSASIGFGLDCNDNDPEKSEMKTLYKDADGDYHATFDSITICTLQVPAGYTTFRPVTPDCDDNDPAVYDKRTLYIDKDGDHYTTGTATFCGGSGVPAGYSADSWGTDCDDNDPNVFLSFNYYKDADGDRCPANLTIYKLCSNFNAPAGYVLTQNAFGIDCDDNNASIKSGSTFYLDADHDGWGSQQYTVICPAVSTPPAGYANNNLDCDDNDASVRYNYTWYIDQDNDGFPGQVIYDGPCTRPAGAKKKSELTYYYMTECNDTNALDNPDSWYQDLDNDGYSSGVKAPLANYGCTLAGYKTAAQLKATSGDCNDNNPAYNPGAATAVWYQDLDGDGYGNLAVSQAICPKPNGYVADNTDCDDGNSAIKPTTVWYKDADNDGATDGTTIVQCERPANYKLQSELTVVGNDCNDNSPGVGSACATTNQSGNYTSVWMLDADGDGYTVIQNPFSEQNSPNIVWFQQCAPGCNWVCFQCDPGVSDRQSKGFGDCNDNDRNIHAPVTYYRDIDGDGYTSGAVQVCSSTPPDNTYKLLSQLLSSDTDCNDNDASIKSGPISGTLYYRDADGDTYGDGSNTIRACSLPAGYVTNANDCNDALAAVNPNTIWYKDQDGDGYTDSTTYSGCTPPSGYVLFTSLKSSKKDCNDTIAEVNPNTRWYKDEDNDKLSDGTKLIQCDRPLNYKLPSELKDTLADCNDNDPQIQQSYVWYKDADGDGYSDGTSILSCTPPGAIYKSGASLTAISGDCDDNNSQIKPGSSYGLSAWFKDADGDGYGDPKMKLMYCSQPLGYVSDSSDCNDFDKTVNPTRKWYKDQDGDGYSDGTMVMQCTQPAGYSPESAFEHPVQGPADGVALNFSPSTSNWVEVPDVNNTLDLGNEFTIEAWINPSDGSNNAIIDKGSYQYLLSHNPNGTTGLGFYRLGNWVYNPMTIPTNTWSHIAMTYSVSTNQVKFYLNGTQVGATQTGAVSLAPDDGPMNIGRQDPSSCQCNTFNGSMDELRLWNKVRTPAEIQANYQSAIDGITAGLVANYHFDQGVAGGNNTSITSVTDASGNNNNGTFGGFALNGQTSNFVNPGGANVKTVLILDGDCNDGDPLQYAGQRWFKDADNDGYSDGKDTVACARPSGYKTAIQLTALSGDCNDNNPKETGVQVWLKDADNDGYSDGTKKVQCPQPAGFRPESEVVKMDSILIAAPESVGLSLNFKESGNNYIAIPDNGTMQISGNLTIEAWINPADNSSNTIIDKGNHTMIFMHQYLGKGLAFYNGTKWFYCNSCDVPANQWSHVAVVYSTNQNYMVFYVNGKFADITYFVSAMTPDNGEINIGRQGPTSCQCNYFNGAIDALRVWNRDLNTNEIEASYNKEITGPENGLVLSYNFNQGIADGDNSGIDTVYDASGSGNNGIMKNFTKSGAVSNWVHTAGIPHEVIEIHNQDCDDNDASVYPGLKWYRDFDGDTLGDPIHDTLACAKPSGYVSNNLDINDSLATTAGAPDIAVAGTTNFGSHCQYNPPVTKTITIYNKGTGVLSLTQVALVSGDTALFHITDTVPGSIAPKDSVKIHVEFKTSVAGKKTTKFYVVSDDASDPIYSLNLEGVIKASDSVQVSKAICAGTSYKFGGIDRSTTGKYSITLQNKNQCDSVVVLNLTVRPPSTGDTTAVVCGTEYTWKGTKYTTSGNKTKVLTNSFGCDSTVTLHLTINNPSVADTTASTCAGSFVWHGTTYTSSGDKVKTFTNAAGCDSVVTLHLTLIPTNTKSSIAGKVLVNSMPATQGLVVLFNASGLVPVPVDTLTVTAGNYKFTGLDKGTYKFLYTCGQACGTAPTYYEKELQYQLSKNVVLGGCPDFDLTNIDIDALTITTNATGTGMINGNLDGGKTGMTVVLVSQPGGDVVGYTTIDGSGNFSFNNLPDGSYKVVTDMPGFPSDDKLIYTIDATNLTVTVSLCANADSAGVISCPVVTGARAIETIIAVSVHPNPTTGNVTLSLNMPTQNDVLIRLVDVRGKLIFAENKMAYSGAYIKDLDLSGFADGMYFLSVIGNKEVVMKRIVVAR